MRTLIIIVGGLVVLLAFTLVAHFAGGKRNDVGKVAKYFIPLWFCAAAINMYIGVTRAGYSAMEELPIFLLIFGLPATGAIVVWRKFS